MLTDAALTALVSSRICHDLISPIGAIGNGVELLDMSGAAAGPEMALIAASVENASARIRFFRIAFGAASEGQMLRQGEITQILADLLRGSRLTVDWTRPGDDLRRDVRLAFLAIQCFETALPFGGRVTVGGTGPDDWVMTAEGDKMALDSDLWDGLRAGTAPDAPAAAQVQFALLPLLAREAGRTLQLQTAPNRIEIRL